MSSRRGAPSLVGLILSTAGIVITPGLVTVGFYMPIFNMISPVSGASSAPASSAPFPSFGA